MAKNNDLNKIIFEEIRKFILFCTEESFCVSNNNIISNKISKSYTVHGEKTKKNQETICCIAPASINDNHKIIFDDKMEYKDLYKCFDSGMNYNLKFIDGALVSLVYEIKDKSFEILTHRLTFFPSPYLFANETSSEEVSHEEIYSDITSKNIYAFPIRFDFDLCNSVDLDHPKSHLTLGQYKNCRIPVTSAVTPGKFFIFILRNFYSSFYKEHQDKLRQMFGNVIINDSITSNERGISHFVVK